MGLGAFTYWQEGYWLSLVFAVKFNLDGSVARLKTQYYEADLLSSLDPAQSDASQLT